MTDTRSGPGYLAPGSDPSVLPGPILIADEGNNRAVVIDPTGHVIWQFPQPGDLPAGETFQVPDDTFFSADHKTIIATEEENAVVSLIDVANRTITYRYGQPGVPGSGPNRLSNPDDALMLPDGSILTADIGNCRILRITPGTHVPAHIYGTTGVCRHNPPTTFGSPNGAFPLRDGNLLVTEINGDWVDEMTLGGSVLWSGHPPQVAYPSDTNEVAPGRYLTVDYSTRGRSSSSTGTDAPCGATAQAVPPHSTTRRWRFRCPTAMSSRPTTTTTASSSSTHGPIKSCGSTVTRACPDPAPATSTAPTAPTSAAPHPCSPSSPPPWPLRWPRHR